MVIKVSVGDTDGNVQRCLNLISIKPHKPESESVIVTIRAVSYTHLDVYKRQVYDAPRYDNSSVVPSVERRTVNPYVTGSSPVRGARLKKPARGNLSGLFTFNVWLHPGLLNIESHRVSEASRV